MSGGEMVGYEKDREEIKKRQRSKKEVRIVIEE